MTEITIKILGPDDGGLLDQVADGVFDNPVVAAHRDRFLATENHVMVIARAGDLVIGMASGVYYCHPDKPETLWINEVGTGDAWLRRGVARRTMTALLDHAKARGVIEAWLGTEPDNIPARRLYQGMDPEEEAEFILYEFDLEP